ncbi:MAG: hypothetical protein K2Y22_15995 [Candidatus Obscuribacterales bacterium]|nr:hypothetical protein [Candidatus Obscuribacterales bacterium]
MRLGYQIIATAACALMLAPQSIAKAYTDSTPTVSETTTLDQIDRALLLDFIRLSRFNIHFRLESNRHQPWRFWTYPLARESGTAATFGGTLTDITQQAKGLHNLRSISKNAIVNGMASSMTGNSISGAASSLELVQNTWICWKGKKAGFSPKDSAAFVKRIIGSTDKLFAQRQQLIEQEDIPHQKLHELETEMLQRIRQQLLYEFLTWSVHSRDRMWRENSFYTVDAVQSFTRLSAIILARRALGDRQFAKPAIVTGLVANSALTLNPIFRNLVGRTVGIIQKHKLKKEFSFERPAPLEGSTNELQKLLADYSLDKEEKHLVGLVDITERSARLDKALDRETKDIERFQQIAQQGSVAGPVIGLTALASSILAAVAIYNYADKPKTANKLGFSGRISQSTGQAAALVYTPYMVMRAIRLNKRLKKREELPGQVLAQRLARLDQIEARVKATTQ